MFAVNVQLHDISAHPRPSPVHSERWKRQHHKSYFGRLGAGRWRPQHFAPDDFRNEVELASAAEYFGVTGKFVSIKNNALNAFELSCVFSSGGAETFSHNNIVTLLSILK